MQYYAPLVVIMPNFSHIAAFTSSYNCLAGEPKLEAQLAKIRQKQLNLQF